MVDVLQAQAALGGANPPPTQAAATGVVQPGATRSIAIPLRPPSAGPLQPPASPQAVHWGGTMPGQQQPMYGQQPAAAYQPMPQQYPQQGYGYGPPQQPQQFTPQMYQQFLQYMQQQQPQGYDYGPQQAQGYGAQQRMQAYGYGQVQGQAPGLGTGINMNGMGLQPGQAQGIAIPLQPPPANLNVAPSPQLNVRAVPQLNVMQQPMTQTVRSPALSASAYPTAQPMLAPTSPAAAMRPVQAMPQLNVRQALGSPAVAMSDATKKVLSQKSLADDFLDHMKAYTYKYKDPSMEPRVQPTGGTYLGVMAQDLERVPHLGPQLVVETPHGKMVDQKTALSATMAGLARLNERMRAVEHDALKRGK